MQDIEDIKNEFEKFVRNRFGNNIKVVAHEVDNHSVKKEKNKAPKNKGDTSSENKLSFEFNLKPKDVRSYLDRFVIGQDEGKKVLSIAVCDHYNQIIFSHAQKNDNYAKQNVLLLGPTGVGKTYIVKKIAKLIGVPFVKADATRFSETGYMGANVEDLIKDLVHQADGDITKAQYGIIYLDEVDKLASASSSHANRDVSGRGVQLGLLKLMEDTDVDLKAGMDPASQMQAFMEMQQKGKVDKQVINTKHILFIISGAFSGLEDIINKRLSSSTIGFETKKRNNIADNNIFNNVTTRDFIDYGLEPEFIGRMPIRVSFHLLTVKSLIAILKNSEDSLLKQYQASFVAYGIKLTITDDAIALLATNAAKEKTGARGLMTVCEKILRDFKYELPSTTISNLTLNAAMVKNPKAVLKDMLTTAPQINHKDQIKIKQWGQEFTNKFGINLKFSPAAITAIAKISVDRSLDPKNICTELFSNYEHGLALVKQNSGRDQFIIIPAMVEKPEYELEKLIKESCQE